MIKTLKKWDSNIQFTSHTQFFYISIKRIGALHTNWFQRSTNLRRLLYFLPWQGHLTTNYPFTISLAG